MAGKYEIYTDKAGEFRFRLKAGNGQTILASEGYSQKAGCENGIQSVQKNSQDADMFKRKDGDDKYSFTLVAGNGQVIGVSESYTSESARENGIESVMENGSSTEVVEA